MRAIFYPFAALFLIFSVSSQWAPTNWTAPASVSFAYDLTCRYVRQTPWCAKIDIYENDLDSYMSFKTDDDYLGTIDQCFRGDEHTIRRHTYPMYPDGDGFGDIDYEFYFDISHTCTRDRQIKCHRFHFKTVYLKWNAHVLLSAAIDITEKGRIGHCVPDKDQILTLEDAQIQIT
ncbi:unnamed protein product [Caenorhabditis sp. 36 PRJEB53466]|nr:unnamed protein product [Caenorhabditis sp. 36 PRJEB53466]